MRRMKIVIDINTHISRFLFTVFSAYVTCFTW